MKANFLFISSLLGYVSFTAAANSVKFINHCPYDIWYWAVGPAGSDIPFADEHRNLVPGNHGSAIHGMVNTEFFNGGMALKLRDYPSYEDAPAGILQIEYNLEPTKNAMWYDLSILDCDHSLDPHHPRSCPLIGGGIKMYIHGADKARCPQAWCSGGKCENVYDRPGSWHGEPTLNCKAGVDIYVETCTESVGLRTFQDELDAGPVGTEPVPVPQGLLKVSPGGTCGGTTGYTCTGSRWGNCCSSYGFCGKDPVYCDAGCQTPFGICPGSNTTSPTAHPPHPPPHPIYKPVPSSSSTAPLHPEHAPIPTVTATITETVTLTTTTPAETVTRTEMETMTVTATRNVFAPIRSPTGGWKVRAWRNAA